MISSVKNVQILVSLLKQHNINHIVISPGSRDFQLVHSVETDDYFQCYSIVDERSAAFFANGLSATIHKPVCVCCTSSTASSNYFPAVVDAYNNHIQLVLLTADRDYRKLYQMEDQMINQVDMYGNFCLKSVNIPIINNKKDTWYSVRKINEALLDLDHNGIRGPVQINYQLMELGAPFLENSPVYRKISRVNLSDLNNKLLMFQSVLSQKKKIMVLCGQQFDEKGLDDALFKFFEKYNAVIIKDNYSNLKNDAFLKTNVVTERMSNNAFVDFCPDMVITIGKHVWSFIKYNLQDSEQEFEHWRIDTQGEIIDPFDRLTNVFEMTPTAFFNVITNDYNKCNNKEYFNLWKNRVDTLKYPQLEFTNFGVIKMLCDKVPDGSLIHTSILNAVRLYDFSAINKDLISFSNLGADGIDGCLPTFLGEASVFKDKKAFLITGDLSFFYGMNSLNDLLSNNVHILLINNYAGSEFHTNFGTFYNDKYNVDDYISAGHKSKAEEWAKDLGICYYSSKCLDEYMNLLPSFVNYTGKPCLFEIFTNADADTQKLLEFYTINKKIVPAMYIRKCKQLLKQLLRK